MYFKSFPTIYYPVVVSGVKQYVQIKDITVNVRFVKEFLNNITLYDLYDVVDGETPEIISEKFYDTPFYHWIIMLANEKYDYINDFPLDYDRLIEYVKDKYGNDNVHAIHHYENSEGYIVSSDYPLAAAISNLDHEDKLNEKKRTIKIIDKRIIERVASDFVKAIK